MTGKSIVRLVAGLAGLSALTACGSNVSVAKSGPDLRPWGRNVELAKVPPRPPAVEVGVVSADGLAANDALLLNAMQREAAAVGANLLVVESTRDDREHRTEVHVDHVAARGASVDATRRLLTARAFRTFGPGESAESLAWVPVADRALEVRGGVAAGGVVPAVGDGGMGSNVSLASDLWLGRQGGIGVFALLDAVTPEHVQGALDLAVSGSVRANSSTGRLSAGFTPFVGVALPLGTPAEGYEGQLLGHIDESQVASKKLTSRGGLMFGGSLWCARLLSDTWGARFELAARRRNLLVEERFATTDVLVSHWIDTSSWNFFAAISLFWLPQWVIE